MILHQFQTNDGSVSYAIWSEPTDEVVLIDPVGNPQPYYDFANSRCSDIVAIIDMDKEYPGTRPLHHAVSSATGALVYAPAPASARMGDFAPLGPGDALLVGDTVFRVIHTPNERGGAVNLLVQRSEQEYALLSRSSRFVGAAVTIITALLF